MLEHRTDPDHPVDKLARIERLAREGIDAATRDLNGPCAASVKLTNVEAEARYMFERAYSQGFDVHQALAYIVVGKPDEHGYTPQLHVTYRPFDPYLYDFSASGFMCMRFESRGACVAWLEMRAERAARS